MRLNATGREAAQPLPPFLSRACAETGERDAAGSRLKTRTMLEASGEREWGRKVSMQ